MVPQLLREPAPTRLAGLDLKAAEQVTRSLLASGHAPSYSLLPMLSAEVSETVHRFMKQAACGSRRSSDNIANDGLMTAFESLHPALDPASRGVDGSSGREYGVPDRRAERKRQQIVNVIEAAGCVVMHVAPNGATKGTLVDLCGGCGHVGLVFAALFPEWKVIVVDAKPFPLKVAQQRAKCAGLNNVDVLEMDIRDMCDKKVEYDIAVALHACADASDIVLANAMQAGAAAIVVPCCVGGLVSSRRRSVAGLAHRPMVKARCTPRSSVLGQAMNSSEFRLLVRAADFGEESIAGDVWRRAAKSIVEADRGRWCEENEYEWRLVKMTPLTCTPMNDIHIVWPRSWTRQVARRTSQERGSVWQQDKDANDNIRVVIDDVDGLSSFDVNHVAEVRRALVENVCAPNSAGEMWFPASQGARQRKLVHGVAGSLTLHHMSIGQGASRRVVVRRSAEWPLFFDAYVGYGGAWVQRTARDTVHLVPTNHVARRNEMRNGRAYHITLVGPHEIQLLSGNVKYDASALLRELSAMLRRAAEPTLVGVGRVVDDKDHSNDVYFCVIDWPAANAARIRLGLTQHDFHITLGFAKKDVHGVQKDRSTLIWTPTDTS